MIGLIKKDLLLLKANLKSLLVIFIIFFLMMVQGEMQISYIIPVIGLMLFISTFSYDDFNHFYAYAITFPKGRKEIVRSKYLASIITVFILLIISFLLSLLISCFSKQPIILEEMFSILFGTVYTVLLIIAIFYPIIFKVGATNGRIYLFVITFLFVSLVGIVSNYIDISMILKIFEKYKEYVILLFTVFLFILLMISYFISKKIVLKKEY